MKYTCIFETFVIRNNFVIRRLMNIANDTKLHNETIVTTGIQDYFCRLSRGFSSFNISILLLILLTVHLSIRSLLGSMGIRVITNKQLFVEFVYIVNKCLLSELVGLIVLLNFSSIGSRLIFATVISRLSQILPTMMFDDPSDLMNKCMNGIFIDGVKIHLAHSQSNPSDISFIRKPFCERVK